MSRIGVELLPSANGRSSLVATICERRSGEALINAQYIRLAYSGLASMAICVCVRGRACSVPWRTPLQLRQAQFHCGKPPPAAEPRILMRIRFQLNTQILELVYVFCRLLNRSVGYLLLRPARSRQQRTFYNSALAYELISQ